MRVLPGSCVTIAAGVFAAVALAPSGAGANALRRGDVLVLDGAGTTLWRVDPYGGAVEPFSPPPPAASLFQAPADVASDADGHVLVVNAGDGRVVEVDPATGEQAVAQGCTFDLETGLVCEDLVLASAPGGIDAGATAGTFYVTTAGGVRQLGFSALLGWGATSVGDAAGVESKAAFIPGAVYFVDGGMHVADVDLGTGLFSAPFQPVPGADVTDVAANPDTGFLLFAQRFPAASGNCLAPTAIMVFDVVFQQLAPDVTPTPMGVESACPRLVAWTPFTAPDSNGSLFWLERAVVDGTPSETLWRIDEPAGGGDPIRTELTDSSVIGMDARAIAVYVPEPGIAAAALASGAALALVRRGRGRGARDRA